jgi:Protein of unknown function (DUF2865)
MPNLPLLERNGEGASPFSRVDKPATSDAIEMPTHPGAAAAALLLLVAATVAARDREAIPAPLQSAPGDTHGEAAARAPAGGVVTAGLFDWLLGIPEKDSPRRGLEPPRSHEQRRGRPSRGASTGTYRTLCVRLCDGFYFPMSYATYPDRFALDAKRCERSCPSRSRLFVHRNPGESVSEMVDLEGRSYRDLPTAFLHQVQYVPDCTCRRTP